MIVVQISYTRIIVYLYSIVYNYNCLVPNQTKGMLVAGKVYYSSFSFFSIIDFSINYNIIYYKNKNVCPS